MVNLPILQNLQYQERNKKTNQTVKKNKEESKMKKIIKSKYYLVAYQTKQ